MKKYFPVIGGMRVLLIFLLLGYHSFAPYSDAWEPFLGQEYNSFYFYWDKFLFAIMLESYLFISGFIYGNQLKEKGLKINMLYLAKRKAKRLLLPCLLFGLLYFILIEKSQSHSLITLYNIISGVGHLWFLPMLFWCFIILSMIEMIPMRVFFKFLFILSLCIFVVLPLPFRLDVTFHFLIYFYIGYLWSKHNFSLNRVSVYTSFLSFLLVFYITEVGGGVFASQIGIVNPTLKRILLFSLRIIYKVLGLISVYSFFDIYYKNHIQSEFVRHLGSFSFGVYIYHQFIIKEFYYSNVIELIKFGLFTPWLVFVLSLLFSLLVSYITLQFDLGRKLIG